MSASCRACDTHAGCVKHKRFTCETCGALTSWSDGGDDDRPNDCSSCWLSWFTAVQSVADALLGWLP